MPPRDISQDPYKALAYQFIADGMDPKVALDMARIALDGPEDSVSTHVIPVKPMEQEKGVAKLLNPKPTWDPGEGPLAYRVGKKIAPLAGAVKMPGKAEVEAYNTPGPGPVPAFDRFRSNLRYGLSNGMKGPAEQAHRDEQISAATMLKEYVMAQDAQRAAEAHKAELWRATYTYPEAGPQIGPPVASQNPAWGTLGSTTSATPFAPLRK